MPNVAGYQTHNILLFIKLKNLNPQSIIICVDIKERPKFKEAVENNGWFLNIIFGGLLRACNTLSNYSGTFLKVAVCERPMICHHTIEDAIEMCFNAYPTQLIMACL